MSRIRYGIKSVYYAVITEGEDGNVTYATPVALPGAKSISLSAEGDKLEEYADNAKWYVENVNQGFSGDLVVVMRRFYYEPGRVEYTLNSDKCLNEVEKTMSTPGEYRRILAPCWCFLSAIFSTGAWEISPGSC